MHLLTHTHGVRNPPTANINLTPRQEPVCSFSRSSNPACRISPGGKGTTSRAMPMLRVFFDSILRTVFQSVTVPQDQPFAEMCGFLRLLGSIRKRLPGRHPRRSSQEESLLLQLPVELLLDISGLLPSESAFALALTFTSFFGILFPKDRLHGIQLEELLQLLERDLSKQFFFCQPCHTLHRFSPSWRPRYQDRFDGPCKPKVELRDTFQLGFHFARLALNKHLLRGGLDLEQLTFSLPIYSRGWGVSSTARVIQDELYLSVTHALSLNGTGPESRQELEASKPGICNHVTTHRPRRRLNRSAMQRGNLPYRQWLQQRPCYAVPQRNRIPELAPRDSPSYSYSLAECRDTRGSCPVCLTDYSITTNQIGTSNFRNETAAKELWDIVIGAYHQLGPYRSQSDWKWLMYATQLPDLA